MYNLHLASWQIVHLMLDLHLGTDLKPWQKVQGKTFKPFLAPNFLQKFTVGKIDRSLIGFS